MLHEAWASGTGEQVEIIIASERYIGRMYRVTEDKAAQNQRAWVVPELLGTVTSE